jgi:hypothetical protein
MRRLRSFLLVMASCVRLSAGLVLSVGQPDETEQLLRRYGPVKHRYIDNSGPGPYELDSITFQTDFQCADRNRSDIDGELAKLRWTQLAYTARSALYHKPRSTQRFYAGSSWRDGRMHVTYSRPATSSERFLYRLKTAVGIGGSRAP